MKDDAFYVREGARGSMDGTEGIRRVGWQVEDEIREERG